jgi:succinate dehydrogenase/fumarate reductase flavoprotein subunit
LSFQHCSESALRAAFGPVIDRLAKNNIDLTKMPVEVAPIAHYHMGGVVADARMQTEVPGLLVAGEAVGGANGANRLSGNAITEALVFGRRAGKSAVELVKKIRTQQSNEKSAREILELITHDAPARTDVPNTAAMVLELQFTMADDVGPLRSKEKLERALMRIDTLTTALGDCPLGDHRAFDLPRLEWFDLRNMLLVARTVAQSALARGESRGAHQREDFLGMLPEWRINQVARLKNDRVELEKIPAYMEMVAQ